ncbi:sensor histidine kinase [Murimonas intestini]|uniref:sensor histidine kinase n=1 Tax=Murimonas intestini TaxID=1337051 RepID=UPI00214BD54B|nr:histidine kinase [Murimonas intestini]MCR1866797.1 histidine kinase [Murimonas intestini]MCR1883630.1 histidine kinase [Murimonas intestini]
MIKYRRPNRIFLELFIPVAILCMLVISIGYFVYYRQTITILQEKQEQETLQKFRQQDSGLDKINDEIDKIFNILLNNLIFTNVDNVDLFSQLNRLSGLKEGERITRLKHILAQMDGILEGYSQLVSIDIYTSDQNIISCSEAGTFYDFSGMGDYPLYRNGTYQNVMGKENDWYLFGANPLGDISISSRDKYNQDTNVITWAHKLFDVKGGSQIGMICLSIQEDYISDSYRYIFDSKEADFYLADIQSGEIISSLKSQEIGQECPYITEIGESVYGNLSAESEGERINVLYYRLSSADWLAVSVYPYSGYQKDTVLFRRIFSIILAVTLVSLFVILLLAVRKIMRPVEKLMEAMAQVQEGNLEYKVAGNWKNEVGLLVSSYNSMAQSVKNLIIQKERVQQEKTQQEILALRAQINPHFMLNTLNTIKCMAVMARAENVENSIVIFGKYIEALFRVQKAFHTIREEIDFLKNYIKIYNMRFGEVVKLELDVEDELWEIQIPRIVLQPVVENSLQHAFDYSDSKNVIRIAVTQRGEQIELLLQDNGRGMSLERLMELRIMVSNHREESTGEHVGIANVARRLYLYYGEQQDMQIISNEMGTTVCIRISRKCLRDTAGK